MSTRGAFLGVRRDAIEFQGRSHVFSAFNSKVYYVVLQGGGMGDRLARFPCTGNETVMYALSPVSGLCYESSTRTWVAGPDRVAGTSQILPVNWLAITQRTDEETNYQRPPCGDEIS